MTVWDKIYKSFQRGGSAWASLSKDLYPEFIEFILNNDFPLRGALDIGCGTGNYLKFLKSQGFQIAGIDSSETAVSMSRSELGDDTEIICADMFDFAIPANKYDLIISISTIQHGTKDQIKRLVDGIFGSLIPGGRIFITLPDFESSKNWGTFKDKEEIGVGTFAPMSGPEKGLPHSFYTREEIEDLFSRFSDLSLSLTTSGRWIITASK